MKQKWFPDKVHHIGVIVRDLDKAIAYYESLGIGPFESLKLSPVEKKMNGQIIALDSLKVRIKMATVGDFKLELIQPISDSFWMDYLKKKGEGINHIGFSVDDINKAEDKFVAQGLKSIYSSRLTSGGGVSYFDTNEVGGFLTELVQWE